MYLFIFLGIPAIIIISLFWRMVFKFIYAPTLNDETMMWNIEILQPKIYKIILADIENIKSAKRPLLNCYGLTNKDEVINMNKNKNNNQDTKAFTKERYDEIVKNADELGIKILTKWRKGLINIRVAPIILDEW